VLGLALGLALCLSAAPRAAGPAEALATGPHARSRAAQPAGAGAGRLARASASQPTSEITLAPIPAGAGIGVTMAPVGLSIEYPVMDADLGAEACPPAALIAELQRLGSPPVELAGVSQDMTAPAGALTGPTSWETGTLFSLPAAFWSQLHCLLSASKDALTVGLNARTGNLAWAAQMVAGAHSAASNGLSFSLGNEPDRYPLPNYSSLDKPFPGQQEAAANLYLQLASYLRPAIGGEPLIGPELSRPATWFGELPRILATLHEQTVGVHIYPLTDCVSPRAVTIGGLLSSSAADSPSRLAWVVADARAAGLPAIVSEANSVSCGGRQGVSDSPAAAVWAVRFVLSALKTGFGEVRFHFSGNSYDPFLVRGNAVLTRPIESALVALNQWLPVGSVLKTVRGVRELGATAVRTPVGGVTVILDNERAQARSVVLHSSRVVQVASLSPARAGLRTLNLSPTGGRIRVSVPANGVLAASVAPVVPAPAGAAPASP